MDNKEFNEMDNMPENSVNLFAEKIKKIFSSSAFLTATVAYTVLAGVSVIVGNINVFAVLFAVGMWLAYTAAKTEVPTRGIKFISGTLKAYYIVMIIAIVFLIIAGVICIAFGPKVMDLGTELDAMLENAQDVYSDIYIEIGGEELREFEDFRSMLGRFTGITFSAFIGIAMIVIGVVLIICAVVSILINEFFVKRLNVQLKNTIEALEVNGETELKLGGIKTWFVVLGVLSAISAVSVLFTFDVFLIAGEAAGAVACFALGSALEQK